MGGVENKRRRRPWYRRWWAWTLGALVVLAVAFTFALQPLTRYATRRALDSVEGYQGSFEDARLTLLPLRYRVTKLKLEPKDRSRPSLYADVAGAGLDWKWLLHGRIRLSAAVSKGKMTLREAKGKAATEDLPDLAAILKKVLPGQLHRVQLRDSEMTYIFRNEKSQKGKEEQAEKGQPTVPKLWIHDVEATVENLATRPDYAEGATTFAASATVNKSGKASIFATADPLAKKGMTFAGQMSLKGMDLKDAWSLVDSKVDLAFDKGTLDLLARFGCDKGQLTGAVQPVLKNAGVTATSDDLFNKIKAWAANLGVDMLSDRVPGRNAVSTVVPIEGTLTDPKLQLWPSIFGVIRNAFVQGIAESFAHLPPPKAKEPEGILEQAKSVTSPEAGLPKAQPRSN
jgi:Domain of Unknown Function (DUF748)